MPDFAKLIDDLRSQRKESLSENQNRNDVNDLFEKNFNQASELEQRGPENDFVSDPERADLSAIGYAGNEDLEREQLDKQITDSYYPDRGANTRDGYVDPKSYSPSAVSDGFLKNVESGFGKGLGTVIEGLGTATQALWAALPGTHWIDGEVFSEESLRESNAFSESLKAMGRNAQEKNQQYVPQELMNPQFKMSHFMHPSFWSEHVAGFAPQMAEMAIGFGAGSLAKKTLQLGLKQAFKKTLKSASKSNILGTLKTATSGVYKGAKGTQELYKSGKGLLGKILTDKGTLTKSFGELINTGSAGLAMNLKVSLQNSAEIFNTYKDLKDEEGNPLFTQKELGQMASSTFVNNVQYAGFDILSWGLTFGKGSGLLNGFSKIKKLGANKIIAKKAAAHATNSVSPLFKKLAKFGGKVVGEGFEETIQETWEEWSKMRAYAEVHGNLEGYEGNLTRDYNPDNPIEGFFEYYNSKDSETTRAISAAMGGLFAGTFNIRTLVNKQADAAYKMKNRAENFKNIYEKETEGKTWQRYHIRSVLSELIFEGKGEQFIDFVTTLLSEKKITKEEFAEYGKLYDTIAENANEIEALKLKGKKTFMKNSMMEFEFIESVEIEKATTAEAIRTLNKNLSGDPVGLAKAIEKEEKLLAAKVEALERKIALAKANKESLLKGGGAVDIDPDKTKDADGKSIPNPDRNDDPNDIPNNNPDPDNEEKSSKKKNKPLRERARDIFNDLFNAKRNKDNETEEGREKRAPRGSQRTSESDNGLRSQAKNIINSALDGINNFFQDNNDDDTNSGSGNKLRNKIRSIVNSTTKKIKDIYNDPKLKGQLRGKAKEILDSAINQVNKLTNNNESISKIKAKGKEIIDSAMKKINNLATNSDEEGNNDLKSKAKNIINSAVNGVKNLYNDPNLRNELKDKAKNIVDSAVNNIKDLANNSESRDELKNKIKDVINSAADKINELTGNSNAKKEAVDLLESLDNETENDSEIDPEEQNQNEDEDNDEDEGDTEEESLYIRNATKRAEKNKDNKDSDSLSENDEKESKSKNKEKEKESDENKADDAPNAFTDNAEKKSKKRKKRKKKTETDNQTDNDNKSESDKNQDEDTEPSDEDEEINERVKKRSILGKLINAIRGGIKSFVGNLSQRFNENTYPDIDHFALSQSITINEKLERMFPDLKPRVYATENMEIAIGKKGYGYLLAGAIFIDEKSWNQDSVFMHEIAHIYFDLTKDDENTKAMMKFALQNKTLVAQVLRDYEDQIEYEIQINREGFKKGERIKKGHFFGEDWEYRTEEQRDKYIDSLIKKGIIKEIPLEDQTIIAEEVFAATLEGPLSEKFSKLFEQKSEVKRQFFAKRWWASIKKRAVKAIHPSDPNQEAYLESLDDSQYSEYTDLETHIFNKFLGEIKGRNISSVGRAKAIKRDEDRITKRLDDIHYQIQQNVKKYLGKKLRKDENRDVLEALDNGIEDNDYEAFFEKNRLRYVSKASRIIKGFAQNYNKVLRKKHFRKNKDSPTNWKKVPVFDTEALIVKLYALAKLAHGSSDFIRRLEDSKVSVLFEFNDFLNTVRPDKQMLLQSMFYIYKNQSNINSVTSFVDKDGKFSVQNSLSNKEITMADNILNNLFKSLFAYYNDKNKSDKPISKYFLNRFFAYKEAAENIIKNQYTEKDYYEVLKFFTQNSAQAKNLLKDGIINFNGKVYPLRGTLKAFLTSENGLKGDSIYVKGTKTIRKGVRDFILAIVATNRRYTSDFTVQNAEGNPEPSTAIDNFLIREINQIKSDALRMEKDEFMKKYSHLLSKNFKKGRYSNRLLDFLYESIKTGKDIGLSQFRGVKNENTRDASVIKNSSSSEQSLNDFFTFLSTRNNFSYLMETGRFSDSPRSFTLEVPNINLEDVGTFKNGKLVFNRKAKDLVMSAYNTYKALGNSMTLKEFYKILSSDIQSEIEFINNNSQSTNRIKGLEPYLTKGKLNAKGKELVAQYVINQSFNGIYFNEIFFPSFPIKDRDKRAKSGLSPGFSFGNHVQLEPIYFIDDYHNGKETTDSGMYILEEDAKRLEETGGNIMPLGKGYKILLTGLEHNNTKFTGKNMYDKGYATIINEEYVKQNPRLKGLYELMKKKREQYIESTGSLESNLLSGIPTHFMYAAPLSSNKSNNLPVKLIESKEGVDVPTERGSHLTLDALNSDNNNFEEASKIYDEFYYEDGDFIGLSGDNFTIQQAMDKETYFANTPIQMIRALTTNATVNGQMDKVERIQRLIAEMQQENLNRIRNVIEKGTQEEIRALLIEAMDLDLVDPLQRFMIEDGLSANTPALREIAINTLSNMIKREGNKLKTPGTIAQQKPAMYEKKYGKTNGTKGLSFYSRKSDGSSTKAEAVVPKYLEDKVRKRELLTLGHPSLKRHTKKLSMENSLRALKIEAERIAKARGVGIGEIYSNDNILQGYYVEGDTITATRIPSHGPQSTGVFEVIDFDTTGGSQVQLPFEFAGETTGGDFDGDMVFIQHKGKGAKWSKWNEVMGGIEEHWLSPEMANEIKLTIDFKEEAESAISYVNKVYGDNTNQKSLHFSPLGRRRSYNNTLLSVENIGITANLHGLIGVLSSYETEITKPITIDKRKVKAFEDSREESRTINSGKILNIIMDNAKHGYTHGLGFNEHTVAMAVILRNLGFDLGQIGVILNSPVAIEWSKIMSNKENVFSGPNSLANIEELIREAVNNNKSYGLKLTKNNSSDINISTVGTENVMTEDNQNSILTLMSYLSSMTSDLNKISKITSGHKKLEVNPFVLQTQLTDFDNTLNNKGNEALIIPPELRKNPIISNYREVAEFNLAAQKKHDPVFRKDGAFVYNAIATSTSRNLSNQQQKRLHDNIEIFYTSRLLGLNNIPVEYMSELQKKDSEKNIFDRIAEHQDKLKKQIIQRDEKNVLNSIDASENNLLFTKAIRASLKGNNQHISLNNNFFNETMPEEQRTRVIEEFNELPDDLRNDLILYDLIHTGWKGPQSLFHLLDKPYKEIVSENASYDINNKENQTLTSNQKSLLIKRIAQNNPEFFNATTIIPYLKNNSGKIILNPSIAKNKAIFGKILKGQETIFSYKDSKNQTHLIHFKGFTNDDIVELKASRNAISAVSEIAWDRIETYKPNEHKDNIGLVSIKDDSTGNPVSYNSGSLIENSWDDRLRKAKENRDNDAGGRFKKREKLQKIDNKKTSDQIKDLIKEGQMVKTDLVSIVKKIGKKGNFKLMKELLKYAPKNMDFYEHNNLFYNGLFSYIDGKPFISIQSKDEIEEMLNDALEFAETEEEIKLINKSLSPSINILTHEITHSILYKSLRTDKAFRRKIEGYYDLAKEKIDASKYDIYDVYGLTDLDEFLAEVISNENFRKILEGIEVNNDKTQGGNLYQRVKALIQETLTNLFNGNNLLESSLKTILNQIEADKNKENLKNTIELNSKNSLKNAKTNKDNDLGGRSKKVKVNDIVYLNTKEVSDDMKNLVRTKKIIKSDLKTIVKKIGNIGDFKLLKEIVKHAPRNLTFYEFDPFLVTDANGFFSYIDGQPIIAIRSKINKQELNDIFSQITSTDKEIEKIQQEYIFNALRPTLNVLTHEIVHSILDNALMFNKPFKEKIQGYFDLAKEKIDESKYEPNDVYGLTSLDEFLAEIVANKNFRKILSQIKFKDDGTKGGDLYETIKNDSEIKGRNLYEKVKALLRKTITNIFRGNSLLDSSLKTVLNKIEIDGARGPFNVSIDYMLKNQKIKEELNKNNDSDIQVNFDSDANINLKNAKENKDNDIGGREKRSSYYNFTETLNRTEFIKVMELNDKATDRQIERLFEEYLKAKKQGDTEYLTINEKTIKSKSDKELSEIFMEYGEKNKYGYSKILKAVIMEVANRLSSEQSQLTGKKYGGNDISSLNKWFLSNNVPSDHPAVQGLVRNMLVQEKIFLKEKNTYVSEINKATSALYKEKFGYNKISNNPLNILKSLYYSLFSNKEKFYEKLYGSLIEFEYVIDDSGTEVKNMKYKSQSAIKAGVKNGSVSKAQYDFYVATRNVSKSLEPFALANNKKGRKGYIPHTAPTNLEALSRRGLLGLLVNSKTIDHQIYDVKMNVTNPITGKKEKDVSFKLIEDWYNAISAQKKNAKFSKEFYLLKRKAINLHKKGVNENGTKIRYSDIEMGTAIGDVFVDRFSKGRSVKATDFPSLDLNKAFIDYTHSSLFIHGNEKFQGFQKMIPIIDGVLAQSDRNGDKKLSSYVDKVWKEYFLAGRKQEKIPNVSSLEAIGVTSDKAIDFITKGSLIYWLGYKGLVIGNGIYSIGNALVGKFNNISNAGGTSWLKGEKRFWKGKTGRLDLTDPFKGVRESNQILKNIGFMDINIYDDVSIESKNSIEKTAMSLALMPMTASERWIQGVHFLGELTDKEWDTLVNGGSLDPKRLTIIENEVKISHGKGYQPSDQRMIQMYSWGRTMMQFSRYIPTMFYDRLAKEDIDIFGNKYIGSYTAVWKTVQKGVNGAWSPKEFMAHYNSLDAMEKKRLNAGLLSFGLISGLTALNMASPNRYTKGLIDDSTIIFDYDRLKGKFVPPAAKMLNLAIE